MPEQLRIRVGSKTHTGALNADNNDRILIGMDPAANDWLYSPDEILTGEFGSLVVLADGLSGNRLAGKTAGMICKIIRKLFDETLELPPDDENLLFLLKKFLKIAHRHLILYAEENNEFITSGASVTMVLIKDFKAYVVWSGHTRLYRFGPGGVQGSIHCSLPNLETITIDHSKKALQKVFPDSFSGQDTLFDNLLSFLGNHQQEPEVSGRIVHLQLNDKLLLCTAGVYFYIPTEDLVNIIKHSVHPELICEDLITKAYNANSNDNISAVTIEIMNGEPSSTIKPLSEASRTELAKDILLPLKEQFQNFTGNYLEYKQDEVESATGENTNIEEPQLEPMKVRTVMPEIKTADLSEREKSAEITFKDQSSNDNQDDPFTGAEEPEKHEMEDSEQRVPSPSTFPNNPETPEYTNFQSKSKPRISKTAYPDPDDYPAAKKSALISLEDIMYFNENQFILSYQIPYIVFDYVKPTSYSLDKIVPFEKPGPSTEKVTTSQDDKVIIDAESEKSTEQEELQVTEESFQQETNEPTTEENYILHAEEEDEGEQHIKTKEDPIVDKTGEIEEVDVDEEPLVFNNTDKSKKEDERISQPKSNASKTKILLYWRVGIVLAALLLIPVLLCREKNKLSEEQEDNSFFPGESKEAPEKPNEDTPAPPAKVDNNMTLEKADNLPVSPLEKTPEKPKNQAEKIVEEKKKSVDPEPEPEYDNRIRENKHQLIDEIETMIRRKDQMCRQIDTYKKNAPSKKTSKIEALQQDCDQLGKKFNSIYDSRTGYFKTVRYDFLDGTIKNIRFSMEQLEQKFTAIRSEE
jgi:serine/threonine protein phosphatase PrpC